MISTPATRATWRIARDPAVMVLAIAAATNLVVAVVLADRHQDRWEDIWVLRYWIQQWLQGRRVYTPADSDADYPPWALLTFLPLALVPSRFVIAVSTMVSMAVVSLLAFVSARVMAPTVPPRALVVPALMVLCWGASVRGIVFFTSLPLLFGLLSVMRGARASEGGLWLGLSMAKPHVGLPFLVWACVRARRSMVLVAAIVVAGQLAVYSLRVGSNPVEAVWGWASILAALYSGDSELIGVTGVRWVFERWFDRTAVVDLLSWGTAAVGLAALVRLRRRDLAAGETAGAPAIVALGTLWCLLFFYHYAEDMILLAPTFMAVYFARDEHPLGRWTMLALIQAILMTDIAQRASLLPADGGLLHGIVTQAYRWLIVVCLAYVALLMRRRRPAAG